MMSRRLGAVLGITMAILLLAPTAALAAEQQVQNGSAVGSIRVAVQDQGTMAVWRYDGATWVEQTFGPYSKYSLLFLAGDNTSMIFGAGLTGTTWTLVSNTTSADNTTITSVFLAEDNNVRVTQTTTVTAGPYYRMLWDIANVGPKTYSDVRFTHGEDTYLAGNDNGEGHFDNALKMVYVMNPGFTADLMGLYSSASTPFSYYFEGGYSTNFNRMRNWTLDNTVNPANVDCGYSLGWMRTTLAPGQTWSIIAYEKFTQSVGVQVIAPAEQAGSPGSTLSYAFTVRNLDAATTTIALSSNSANGWATSVVDGSGNPLPSVILAGGTETVAYVRVAIPSGAAGGTSDLLTLNATFGEGGTSSDSTTTVVSGPAPSPTLTIDNGGLGAGWFGSCGMVVGRDGKGPASTGESAGMIALYFALLLLPVGILKLVHRRKRLPFEKAGIVALFIVASMLVASSAHAVRLVAPKAQRFHPTTDGQGALTVDTDQPLCAGQFNFGFTLSAAKKPLDMGDIRELKIEKVVVDELYTADLTAAYGLTPDITLGLDIPYDFSRDNLNYADYLRNGAPGVRDDVTHLGDIRMNVKYRLIDGGRYGLALIPFANLATGDKDYLLSEGKFGFGMKVAGHYDVTKPLTLYANLGAEHIGKFEKSDSPNYYTPWIQYGVGAKYLLPSGKDSIVAEVNGETSWATPYAHSTLSPLEFLAAYRTEVAPGWTLQAGGGGGLNKGMGAPQWRAILGVAYKR
ncbi:MAG: COG1470 family protein [Desulfobacteria bacterium]